MGKKFMFMDEDLTGAPNLLAGLSDVDISTTPQDGDTLVYNATSGKWEKSDIVSEINRNITTIQDTVINQRAYKNEVLYYTFTSSASTQAEFQKDIARQMPTLCNAAIFQGTWAGHNFYFGDIRRVGSTYYLFYAVSGSTPTAVSLTL